MGVFGEGCPKQGIDTASNDVKIAIRIGMTQS
jgi:hypothetical protein